MTMNGTSVLTLDAMRAKRQRQMAIALMLMAAAATLMLVVAMNTAMASTFGDIEEQTNGMLLGLFGILQNICGGVALVCIGIAVIGALFGGERGMDTARKRLLSIGVCFGLVWLAPLLLNWIKGLFESMGQGAINELLPGVSPQP